MAATLDHRAISPDGADADARIAHLYRNEREAFTFAEAWSLLRRNWHFIARQRRLLTIKTVLAFSSLTFFLLTPWPMKIIVDNVIDRRPLTGVPAAVLMPITGDNRGAILMAVLAFLALTSILIGMSGRDVRRASTQTREGGLDQAGFTANQANDGWSLWNGVFGYYEARVTLDLTQAINQDLRTTIYSRFLKSPLGLYGDQKVGDAVFRVMHDSSAIAAVLYTGIYQPLLSLAVFFMALLVLYLQFGSNEPLIPVLAACALPVTLVGAGIYGRLLRSQSQRMRERGSDVMSSFEERIAQVHLIKAFGQEKRESDAIDSSSWASYRATLRLAGIVALILLTVLPLAIVIFETSVYYVLMQVIDGRITLGEVLLLATYASMLTTPMYNVGATWATLQPPLAGLRRIQSVLDFVTEAETKALQDNSIERIDSVAFESVSLGYGNSEVLSDLSMKLVRGEMIAIAGASGAGKTTLIYSIPRFIEPLTGMLRINAVDLREIAPDAIRARIGFVFQQEALFSVSIEENIRYGNAEATDAQIREAARLAGAHDFIERLPNGYQTVLGRRGARLSIGQKQRIAIARALVRQPDLLILDEPTAPLDPASETALMDTLRNLARDHLVLIVAHRAATLAACDRVYFVHDGGIAASGSNAELLASNRDYRQYLAVTESEIRPA